MSNPYRIPGEVERDIVIPMKRDYWDVFWLSFAISFGIAVILLFAYPLFKVFTADGKADYCFVERETANNFYTGKYTLRQHVPWGSDRTLATGVETTELVRKEAILYGCEIK